MKTWIILDHPTRPRRIILKGFSWGFFFFGSLWAASTRTWGALAYQVGLWVLMTASYIWADAIGANSPWKVPAVLAFYAVGLVTNGLVASEVGELRLQSLLDRGYREATRMDGPTAAFVEAELARAEKAPAPTA